MKKLMALLPLFLAACTPADPSAPPIELPWYAEHYVSIALLVGAISIFVLAILNKELADFAESEAEDWAFTIFGGALAGLLWPVLLVILAGFLVAQAGIAAGKWIRSKDEQV